MIFSYMGISQVAEQLAVSESRVRQLVAARELPRPRKLGPRIQLWERADIRAYVNRTQTSKSAAMLNRPAAPLRRGEDMVIHLRCRGWMEPQPFHVRVYRGADRQVVLLSEPVGNSSSRFLTNFVEYVVGEVSERVLGGTAVEEVVWVDIWPPQSDSADGGRIRNIILEKSGSQSWAPSWSSMSSQDLDDLLGGAPVDYYDWPHYTVPAVANWQRTGQAVQVYDDPNGLRGRVDAVEQITHGTSTAPWSQTARDALLIQLALFAGDVFETEPPHPDVNTSYRVHYELPDLIKEQAQRTQTPTWDQAAEGHYELLRAQESVDEFSDNPDREQFELIGAALAAQRDVMTLVDPILARDILNAPPTSYPVQVEMNGPWDSRYLADASWYPGVDPLTDTVTGITPRAARILLDTAGALNGARTYPGQELTFGLDPRGVPLLKSTWQRTNDQRQVTDVVILWPTRADLDLQDPLQLRVVADGQTGDRPVYLADRHEAIVGLLPRSRQYFGWNFGYGGGGPGQLVSDVRRLLDHLGRPLSDDDNARLEASVQADKAGLDIPLSRFESARA